MSLQEWFQTENRRQNVHWWVILVKKGVTGLSKKGSLFSKPFSYWPHWPLCFLRFWGSSTNVIQRHNALVLWNCTFYKLHNHGWELKKIIELLDWDWIFKLTIARMRWSSNLSLYFPDINECETENGKCSQTCRNKPGSYECECNRGYSLAYDKRTCIGKLLTTYNTDISKNM